MTYVVLKDPDIKEFRSSGGKCCPEANMYNEDAHLMLQHCSKSELIDIVFELAAWLRSARGKGDSSVMVQEALDYVLLGRYFNYYPERIDL